MGYKIFGVSVFTILVVIATALIVRKFGDQIPLLSSV